MKTIPTLTRFDLEQTILAVWNTKDDIDLLLSRYLDGEVPMTEDEVSNFLIGISALHQARCEKAFTTFEQMVADRKII
jgi:hypothetical protein